MSRSPAGPLREPAHTIPMQAPLSLPSPTSDAMTRRTILSLVFVFIAAGYASVADKPMTFEIKVDDTTKK